MVTFDEASESLESLLAAMDLESTTPTWYAIEDHPSGGYEEYSCSIAPFIHWLLYEESSMPSRHSRNNDMVRGGVLAKTFGTLDEDNREHVFTLLRYLCEQRCSFKESLISLEGDQGARIFEGLKISGWI